MSASPEDVAIVGMACIVPRADTPAAFWQNIVHHVDCIGDPPPGWCGERNGDEVDVSEPIYTRKGGYLGNLSRFNPARHGVVPNSVAGAEPDQFLALRCAAEALADAGVPELQLHREKTGVILGRGTFINRGILTWVAHGYVVDQVVTVLRQLDPERSDDDLALIRAELKRNLPPFHAETVPGVTPCLLVGRMANKLDLKGPAYTLDAACSSTLLAVEHGLRLLRSGCCDAVLAGGVQISTPVLIHQLFCRIEGLSRTGRIAPLSAAANGTLIGEGCGILVLKRRRDAERDRNRIYALIKAVGVSSDGRGAGLMAPQSEGQQLALRRAYQLAGVSPSSIALLEAHATGIPLGDRTELASLRACFGGRDGDYPTIALGSVKSMIGHLLPASGAASLIKTALALYHRTLPPTLHAECPHPELGLERSPFYPATHTRPWIHGDAASPRRAAVNAFGFGGINAHVVLEEHPVPDEAALPRLESDWPAELVVVSAAGKESLRIRVEALASWVEQAQGVRLLDVAASCAAEDGPCRVAIVTASLVDLVKKLTHVAKLLGQADRERIQDRSGIFWYQQPLARNYRVALVFSGAGSQYPHMLGDLCRHFPEVRRQFDLTDAAYQRMEQQLPLSRLIFPLPEEKAVAEASLLGIQAAMTSVMAAERALLALVERLGIRADAVVGHSNGEFVAFQAAGAFRPADEETLLRSIVRGAELAARLAQPGLVDDVVLTAVGGVDNAALAQALAESGGKLVMAMDNCPHQAVVAGAEMTTATALARLRAKGGLCEKLPVRALHTEAFAPACDIVAEYFETVSFESPAVELWSCTLADRYPREPAALQELAVRQLRCRVRFRETIQAMYEAGVRVFLEVGPCGKLSAFISDTLGKQPHAAIPLDQAHRNGLEQLCRAVGMLVAHAVPMDLPELYRRRQPRQLDLMGKPPRAEPQQPFLSQELPELKLSEAAAAKWARHGQVATPAASSSPGGPEANGIAQRTAGTLRTPVSVEGPRAKAMADYHRSMRLFLETQEQLTLRQLAALRARVDDESVRNGQNRATAPLPFIETVLLQQPDHLVAECELDVGRHRFLLEHTFFGRQLSLTDPMLGGLPVMPLAMTLELLAEAAVTLRPGLSVCAVREVRTHGWLAFETPTRRVRMEAKAMTDREVRVVLYEADGEGQSAPVAEAIIELAAAQPDDLGPPVVPDEAQTLYPWPGTVGHYGHSQEEVYGRILFHGPTFQTIAAMQACDRNATRATVRATDPALLLPGDAGRRLVLPVALIDSTGQIATFAVVRDDWTADSVHMTFPNYLERVEFARRREDDTAFRAVARVVPEANRVRSDLELTAPDGRVLLRVLGRSEESVRLPGDFYSYWSRPRQVVLSRPLHELFQGVPCVESCTLCEVINAGGKLLVKGLWAQVLARMILSREERRAFADLKLRPVPAASWLLGRVVTKDAVRLHAELDVCMADVVIDADKYGRPYVHQAAGAAPLLSLAHKGFAAVALAADPEKFIGVGIDLEALAPLDSGVKADAISNAEHLVVETATRVSGEPVDHWYLSVWSAKEAVGKALGRGVLGGPQGIEVVSIDPRSGRMKMVLRGAMAGAFPSYAAGMREDGHIEAYRRVHGPLVITICLLSRG